MAHRDYIGRTGNKQDADEIPAWIEYMQEQLEDIEPGEQYIYFDGAFVATSFESLEFEGWHAKHDLDFLPQLRALTDPSVIDLLSDRNYWEERAVS